MTYNTLFWCRVRTIPEETTHIHHLYAPYFGVDVELKPEKIYNGIHIPVIAHYFGVGLELKSLKTFAITSLKTPYFGVGLEPPFCSVVKSRTFKAPCFGVGLERTTLSYLLLLSFKTPYFGGQLNPKTSELRRFLYIPPKLYMYESIYRITNIGINMSNIWLC